MTDQTPHPAVGLPDTRPDPGQLDDPWATPAPDPAPADLDPETWIADELRAGRRPKGKDVAARLGAVGRSTDVRNARGLIGRIGARMIASGDIAEMPEPVTKSGLPAGQAAKKPSAPRKPRVATPSPSTPAAPVRPVKVGGTWIPGEHREAALAASEAHAARQRQDEENARAARAAAVAAADATDPKVMRRVRAGAITTTVLVGALAAIISYAHQRDLALAHGQGAALATLFPFCIDGLMVAASLGMYALRRAGRTRALPTTGLALGVAASIAANVLSAPDDLVARAIAAAPPITLFLTYEVALLLVRRTPPQPDDDTAADATTDPSSTAQETP